tara:strand:- start:45 stop:431 length:387 start_codon:yes stop_codon:yes gene_type:complete
VKKKILIVEANYYKNISSMLLRSAKHELKNFGQVKTISVTGVFEIPVVISRNIKKYDGFLALGCVIKGQTPHFDFISKSTIDAIMNISVKSKKPVGNGIITCLNKKQAEARGKKGREAAIAVKTILLI